ncbi:excalibur calcium-binding domain-containing protein [Streptomyces sp. NPDC051561]|uniref:excalibur calcium-binding domain-containing protein n=1 Tax=Streptomyces sp. NPDC051561 TaxID=3365658 RepID=UPI0037A6B710
MRKSSARRGSVVVAGGAVALVAVLAGCEGSAAGSGRQEGVRPLAAPAPTGAGGPVKVVLELGDDEASGPSGRQIILASLANDRVKVTGGEARVVTREVGAGTYRLSVTGKPRNGAVTVSGTNLVYVSTDGYVGEDEFTYQVAGRGVSGLIDTAVVRVTVNEPVRVTEPPEEPEEEDDGAWGDEEPEPGESGRPTKPAAFYASCAEARAAGAAPVRRGDPGYGRHLDRDGDGVACAGKEGKPGGGNGGGGAVFYKSCEDVKAAGAAPIRRGDPGYGRHLDHDGDGTGCDW